MAVQLRLPWRHLPRKPSGTILVIEGHDGSSVLKGDRAYHRDFTDLILAVDASRAALEKHDFSRGALLDFIVTGAWSGRRWSRSRSYTVMVYVALWNARGEWVDHAEDVARMSRSGEWEQLQPVASAVKKTTDFVMSNLELS